MLGEGGAGSGITSSRFQEWLGEKAVGRRRGRMLVVDRVMLGLVIYSCRECCKKDEGCCEEQQQKRMRAKIMEMCCIHF